jgi:hypothetical protein
MIGQSLEEVRKDLRLVPTQALMQYKQNPGKQAIDGMPLDMLAGLELSRRAQLQQQRVAQMSPNPQQMPTVVDAAAASLSGAPQQGAVPQMPNAPVQFQSAPPAAQPQPAGIAQLAPAPQAQPQPQAAAPQAQAQPQPQPQAAAPQRMAVGGIVSLGDMMQQGMQGAPMPGTPVQMMARGGRVPVRRMAGGGIVAFKNNDDQPVDVNMPSGGTEDYVPPGDDRSQFRQDVSSLVDKLTPTEEQERFRKFLEARRQQGAPIQYFLSPGAEYQKNKAVREFINDNPQAFSTPEARQQFMADPSGFISTFKTPTPEGATATPDKDSGKDSATTAGPVKPDDMKISSGGGQDVNSLLAALKLQQGAGTPSLDTSKLQGLVDKYMKPTDQEVAYQNLVKEQMDAIRNRPSPEVSEAERKRILKEQFDQNQAMSKPYYDKMQQMIDEERAATKARFADSASNARLRFGLGLLGNTKPGFGQALSAAATPALDYYDKAQELEAAANAKSRQAQMDLMKSRMADEKGDREAAQRYFDSYQKNRREAETYQIQKANMLIIAQKGLVDTEGKRERAGMAMQSAIEKMGLQSELGAMRNQLGLMNIAAKMAGTQKPLTVNERIAVDKRADEMFASPQSGVFQKYISAMPNGAQLLADLKNGRIKPDNPQFQAIVNQAKNKFKNDLISSTRSYVPSSGVTSYEDAASELGLQ